MSMHFGANLRLLRLGAGVGLRELAQRVGVSSAYLSRVENGHDAPPTADRLVDIARALGLHPALLVELAHKAAPLLTRYQERVPAASALFRDIARRNLNASQLARLQAFVDSEFPTHPESGGAPSLAAALAEERVILRLACSDLEDAVELAAARLARCAGAPSAAELAALILRREQSASTWVGEGLAVPHALLPGVPSSAVLMTLARPLRNGAESGQPLRALVVMVGQGGPFMDLLAHVTRLGPAGLAGAVANAGAPQEALGAVRALEERL